MGDGSGVRTQFLSTDGSRRGCAVEIWHFLAVEGPDGKIKVSRSWLFMRGERWVHCTGTGQTEAVGSLEVDRGRYRSMGGYLEPGEIG